MDVFMILAFRLLCKWRRFELLVLGGSFKAVFWFFLTILARIDSF